MEDEEDWDQHILEIQDQGRIHRSDSAILASSSIQSGRSNPSVPAPLPNAVPPVCSVSASNPDKNSSVSGLASTSVSTFPNFERMEEDEGEETLVPLQKPEKNTKECKLCSKRFVNWIFIIFIFFIFLNVYFVY